ncbi:MAG TPA: phosphoribosylamine--glycine ligase [Chitinophagaceae bacterium]|jgi:phosphoribosylamine--glycine ligase|nr:phosphoribosylamine--glycine ligase [Chitinophagaceae bacterium]
MNILLLGSGGREHALAWKLRQSPSCQNLFIAPGNAGTATCGTNLPFTVTDFEAIRSACTDHQIHLLVVGPEEPLVKGVVDFLRADPALKDLLIIGPSQEAAQLEGSKAYAKVFMQRHGIPTAAYREFTEANYAEGIEYIKQHPLPIVLKADGLAAGKGVIIAQNHIEAVSEFELMIQRSKFGEAGRRVVIEEFLTGIELSVFVLTDGKHYLVLPEAKDYKRIGEGDTGPNTGGMGAVSPVPFADAAFMDKVIRRVVAPTVHGLQEDGLDYKGFVFCGLIKVGDDPYVIEYNCRMGDPETEAVMPRLQNDLVVLLAATARGELDRHAIKQDPRFATTFVAASGGYPDEYAKGLPIEGLEAFANDGDTLLFQAGTATKDGQTVTSGGRVFCITSLADTLDEAIDRSRDALETVRFEGMYYRRDIGFEFVSGNT